MFRSPHQLRTGSKGKPVLLSASDKANVQSTLSAPTTTSQAATTMPPANKDTIDAALLAAIQAAVEKAVKTAVEAALASYNEEIRKLQEEVSGLHKKVQETSERLEVKIDELEQYQRRNNIRLFGIKESADEDTDELVSQLCRDKLGIDLPADAISRSHRVGRRQEMGTGELARHRPIIVRFTTYRARRMVYQAKKKLKGTGVTIREDLTHRRLEVYREAVSRYGVRSVWTQDGGVLWTDNTGKRGVATRLTELPAKPPSAVSIAR